MLHSEVEMLDDVEKKNVSDERSSLLCRSVDKKLFNGWLQKAFKVSRLGLDSLLTEEDVDDDDDDDDDDGFVELIPVGKDGATTYRTTALDRTTLYRLKKSCFCRRQVHTIP